MITHGELIANWQRMDAASRQANTEAWLAELATWKQRAEAAEAKLAEWQVAFGLLTTLAPVEIDITDPLGMAQAIERHVLAQQGEVQS